MSFPLFPQKELVLKKQITCYAPSNLWSRRSEVTRGWTGVTTLADYSGWLTRGIRMYPLASQPSFHSGHSLIGDKFQQPSFSAASYTLLGAIGTSALRSSPFSAPLQALEIPSSSPAIVLPSTALGHHKVSACDVAGCGSSGIVRGFFMQLPWIALPSHRIPPKSP